MTKNNIKIALRSLLKSKLFSIINITITYYLIKKWLLLYKNKIDITWTIFGFAAFIHCVITKLTIGYQTLKEVMTSPVNSLRAE